jgi:AcrR family transcriptional regulator
VDDIVQAAGAAKGTFYLYSQSKDDAVKAVAERMVQGVANRVEGIANIAGLSPIDSLLALGRALSDVGSPPRSFQARSRPCTMW